MNNMIREVSLNLLTFEKIEMDVSNGKHSYRAKVPGGWILRLISISPASIDHMFLVDKNHSWGYLDQNSKTDETAKK